METKSKTWILAEDPVNIITSHSEVKLKVLNRANNFLHSLIKETTIRKSKTKMAYTLCTIYTILFFTSFSICSARDTITLDNPIHDSGGESLVSAQKRFELGFFTPSGSSKHGRYVGIWYYKSSPRVIVWIANRNNSASKTTGAFTIAEDGDLQVQEDNNKLWSANTGGSISFNRTVKLLDSGNLVLIEGQAGLERIIWQSFDNPTDTFLPGMKMTAKMSLTSWKSQADPAPGNFTFLQDQDRRNQYIIENRASPHWKSGLSGKFFHSNNNIYGNNSHVICPAISSLLSNYTSGTRRPTYQNMTFDTHGQVDYYGMRLVMDLDGHIKFFTRDNDTASASWNLTCMEPRDNCSLFNACGNFGSCNIEETRMCKCLDGFEPKELNNWNSGLYSDGCTRNSNICGKGDHFILLKIVGVEAPGGYRTDIESADKCKEECLDRCECQAYSFERTEMSHTKAYSYKTTATCWIWSEELNDIQESKDGGSEARALYVRVGSSDIGT